MDVLFDGQRLNVRMKKDNYKQIIKIAEGAQYHEYFHSIGVMSLPPTRRIARELDMLGLSFDGPAKIFLQRVKETKIKSLDFSLLSGELYNYQKEGVQYLYSHDENLILGDEMGLGKTIQIAAYLFYSMMYPALIVCPASLKLNWEREIGIWAKKKALVLDGLSPYAIEGLIKEFPVVIINYDILGRKDPEEIREEAERVKIAKRKKYPFRHKKILAHGWVDILSSIPFKTLIIDEVQFVAEPDTARTQSLIQICKAQKKMRIIPLSGTPYTAATEQFFTCLHLVAPRIFPNRWRYKMQFCNPVKNKYGWQFNGLSNGKQLHNLVSGIMLRRLKKDVLKDLPPKQKAIIPLRAAGKAYEKYMIEEQRVFLEMGGKTDIRKVQLDYQTLKYLSFEVKKESALQWVKEYLEVNEKIVLFCYHRESFHFLMDEFGGKAVGINGEIPSGKRQSIIDRFQNDKGIRIFVGQIKAAGVGITLTAASAVAFLEIGDTAAEHEQAEDRVHRISQKADYVMAYYLITPDSIDEDAVNRIKKGYANQRLVLDGDTKAEFISDSPADFAQGVLQDRLKRLQDKNFYNKDMGNDDKSIHKNKKPNGKGEK